MSNGEYDHARWQGETSARVSSLGRQVDSLAGDVKRLQGIAVTDERVSALTRAVDTLSGDLSELQKIVDQIQRWRWMLMGASVAASGSSGLIASLVFHLVSG